MHLLRSTGPSVNTQGAEAPKKGFEISFCGTVKLHNMWLQYVLGACVNSRALHTTDFLSWQSWQNLLMFQYASLTEALSVGDHSKCSANSKHPTGILPYYLLYLLLNNSLYVKKRKKKRSALYLNKSNIQLSSFTLREPM